MISMANSFFLKCLNWREFTEISEHVKLFELSESKEQIFYKKDLFGSSLILLKAILQE